RAGHRSRPLRQPRYVHELIAEQAAGRPGSTAVVSAGTRLTYRQLDQSANRLARYLRGTGVGAETLVGVHLERGIEAIRWLVAILKAGGAYLPLDPSLPAPRLTRMCAEAAPAAIVSAGEDVAPFGEGGARLIPVGELAAELADHPATVPERPGTGLRPD